MKFQDAYALRRSFRRCVSYTSPVTRTLTARYLHAGAWLLNQVALLAHALGEDLSTLGGLLEMESPLFPEEPWT
jgi:hypothetical protein